MLNAIWAVMTQLIPVGKNRAIRGVKNLTAGKQEATAAWSVHAAFWLIACHIDNAVLAVGNCLLCWVMWSRPIKIMDVV